ncbi:GNAT family N-acetyltransferase [Streptomyces sp. NPDC048416]|uniref:GNAT family N-acetyltransferase n=1 Tax=Streptomyces sp. NPDC048416 TaxID=3365546 RepID=UPI00371B484C
MPAPVILSGRSVRLEPLAPSHAPALAAAAAADRTSYAFTPVPHGLDAAYAYIDRAVADQRTGRTLAFATVRAADGLVVGSTRFCELDYWDGPVEWPPAPRGPLSCAVAAVPDAAEIGGTWLSAHAQGTGINTEAKLLMFQHAFDTWRVRRISLRADARNARSRAAIEGLGAVCEGVRRVHTRGLDGLVRGTAFYSVLDEEWPTVRRTIEQRLERARPVADSRRLVPA